MAQVIDTILVYRESPEWDKVDRWFQMRSDLLKSLFVDKWERTIPDDADQRDFDFVGDRHIAEIRAKYDFPVVIVA